MSTLNFASLGSVSEYVLSSAQLSSACLQDMEGWVWMRKDRVKWGVEKDEVKHVLRWQTTDRLSIVDRYS